MNTKSWTHKNSSGSFRITVVKERRNIYNGGLASRIGTIFRRRIK